MEENKENILYTIGHSNHDINYFISLLKKYNIGAVADVRSVPASTRNPQYTKNQLEETLKEQKIAYVFLGKELGARRNEPELYIDNKVIYSLVEESPIFKKGINRLLNGINKMNVTILCSEKDPLRCHRTILISRHIKKYVKNIFHILWDGSIESQDEAEKRLMYECKQSNDDFFIGDNEQIFKAYNQRASEIAYTKQGRNEINNE